MIHRRRWSLWLTLSLLGTTWPAAALSQGPIVPDCGLNCGLDDLISVFARLARFGFAILGIVALVFFVYGGFTLLISGGRQDYIQRGKSLLTGTFLGTLVVLTAFVIVNTVGTFLGAKENLLNTAPKCRTTFTARCSDVLRYRCADPPSADGSVTRLQQLLSGKCPECNLEEDGCFGEETAKCLWFFKFANGLEVPATVTEVTADQSTLDLLIAEQSNACRQLPEPPLAEPDGPAPDPFTQPGCCVPGAAGFACIDSTVSIGCPVDIPTSPDPQPHYTFQSGGDCRGRTQCQIGCCVTINRDATTSCCAVAAGATCPAGSFFTSSACNDYNLCPRNVSISRC